MKWDTVNSEWPLKKIQWLRWDSNPRPSGYMTTDLPSELQSHRWEQRMSESHMNLHVERSFLQQTCGTCITCEEQINLISFICNMTEDDSKQECANIIFRVQHVHICFVSSSACISLHFPLTQVFTLCYKKKTTAICQSVLHSAQVYNPARIPVCLHTRQPKLILNPFLLWSMLFKCNYDNMYTVLHTYMFRICNDPPLSDMCIQFMVANNFFPWKDIRLTKSPFWSDKTKVRSDIIWTY